MQKIKANTKLLKAYMKEKDLNVTQMAEEMNIDRTYLSDVLNNDKNVGEKFIAGALKVTNYDFNELFFLGNVSHKFNTG